jgi:methylenetetrahydrofolate dehydrogenase (NAD+)
MHPNTDAPLLVGLLANDDPAAVQYAEWTGKACRADGLRYDLRRVDRLDVERALQVRPYDLLAWHR